MNCLNVPHTPACGHPAARIRLAYKPAVVRGPVRDVGTAPEARAKAYLAASSDAGRITGSGPAAIDRRSFIERAMPC